MGVDGEHGRTFSNHEGKRRRDLERDHNLNHDSACDRDRKRNLD